MSPEVKHGFHEEALVHSSRLFKPLLGFGKSVHLDIRDSQLQGSMRRNISVSDDPILEKNDLGVAVRGLLETLLVPQACTLQEEKEAVTVYFVIRDVV